MAATRMRVLCFIVFLAVAGCGCIAPARAQEVSIGLSRYEFPIEEPENATTVDVNLAFSYSAFQDPSTTPDCVYRQPLVLVNGKSPPPTIIVKAGQWVRINTISDTLAVVFTIHMHGMKQSGTPWSDGTGMITNCPIQPSTLTNTYYFQAPLQVGTHLYHGHVNHVKVSGFTGLFIVEPNEELGVEWPSTYEPHDSTAELMLADTFQLSELATLQSSLSTETFVSPFYPASMLINGKSWTNCSVYSDALSQCAIAGGDVNNGESESDQIDQGVDNAPGLLPQDCMNSIAEALKSPNGVPIQPGIKQPLRFFNTLALCYPKTCPGRAIVPVDAGKTYLFRVGNTGVMSNIYMIIEGHNFTVVELDSLPIVPKVTDHLILNQGQRATILLTADQDPGVYFISSRVFSRPFEVFGSALLVYDGATPTFDQSRGHQTEQLKALEARYPVFPEDLDVDFEYQRSFEALVPSNAIPDPIPDSPGPENTFVFVSTQEFFNEPNDIVAHLDHTPAADPFGFSLGTPGIDTPHCYCESNSTNALRWAVNRKPFHVPSTPLLHGLYFGTETRSEEELAEHGIYKLVLGQTYDIVLQNYATCKGVCETHPWHLHGHDFWIVGTFPGQYNGTIPEDGGGQFMRDTANLVANPHEVPSFAGPDACDLEPTAGCGFTVLRFVADNPGVWFFHCHIDWHLEMGMAVAFYYDNLTSLVPEPDFSTLHICGEVTPQKLLEWQELRLQEQGGVEP